MRHRLRYTADKIRQRIALIRPLIFRQRRPIPALRLLELPDATTPPPLDAPIDTWPEIPAHTPWGRPDLNFLMRSECAIPWGWRHEAVALHLPMGEAGDIFTHPEALLYIDGQPFASADRYHHTIRLPADLADGNVHQIALHGWTGLSGWPPDPQARDRLMMREPALVEIDDQTFDFVTLAETALDVCRTLDDDDTAHRGILTALDRAFVALDTRDPLGDAFYASLPQARQVLQDGLAAAGSSSDVTLHAIGHAHMDIAYLWPISQIRRKNGRTYSNVLRLMERYPDYRFSHTQPQLYKYTQTDYPQVFDAIKSRVADGQWELMGGMWVEPDVNIPGPESLVRQLFLGRRFFRDHFGDVDTPVLWLPDTFGFSWCLPQLMKQAGLKWFVTNKVNWNQYSRMPASTCWWQGIDGTQVMTHFLTTPREVQHLPFPTNYKSDLSAAEVLGTWTQSTCKGQVRDLPIAYGYGDGGGGPTETLIQKARIFGDMPGAPRMQMGHVGDMFEMIEAQQPELSVWNDEIYLEGHRGVFTSQGWLKRANRKAEVLLHDAEALAAMAGTRPDLQEAWELLCLHQFHDTLAGTAIRQVFEEAAEDFDTLTGQVTAAINTALAQIPAPPDAVAMVTNTVPHNMPRIGCLPAQHSGLGAKGQAMLTQIVGDDTLVYLPDCPAFAALPLSETDGAPLGSSLQASQDASGVTLENALIRIRFDPNGELVDVFDKEVARAVLKDGQIGNRLQAFEDRPISWDAWDIDVFFEDRGDIVPAATRMTLVEHGPIRATVEIERKFRHSTIVQRISVCHHSKRIDFHTVVDWHETHVLLKVAFPVTVLSPVATYEIQWGVITRPTHRNTSWDYAKFEVPAQRWADLSEGDYGVALLNDCKYGYDIHDDVLRLSLIKSATMPDVSADQGRHEFTYALLPHTGDWRNGVQAQAWDLNVPLRITPPGTGNAQPSAHGVPFVAVSRDSVVVETLKPAADLPGAVVVRLFESNRTRGPVTLHFARPLAQVWLCNLLEDLEDEVAVDGHSVTLNLRPFEIVSLMVTFDE